MQKTKPVLLLDFDFTLCDSSTRENTHTKNDCLDLAAYVKDTAEHDKGLPLLRYLLKNKAALQYKYNIIILTNRDFDQKCGSKVKKLVNRTFTVLHRGNLAPMYGDDFKAILLSKIGQHNEVVLIDDDPHYLNLARNKGGRAICARDLWHYNAVEFTKLLLG